MLFSRFSRSRDSQLFHHHFVKIIVSQTNQARYCVEADSETDAIARRKNGEGTLLPNQHVAYKIENQTPRVMELARNAANAIGSAIKNPTRVSDEEKARRLAICAGCEFLIKKEGKSDRCAKCGCFLKWKTALESWHCPIKKW
jgi:hypothetical protein